LNYTHDALVDQIIANPAASNAELGAVFGRTKEWVGMVKNSDLFREKVAERKGEIVDPALTASVEERFQMVARRSLEVLMDKLAQPVAAISDGLALEAAKLGAKGLGIGGFSNRPAPPPEAPQMDRIERLADRLTALNGVRPQPITDVVEMQQTTATDTTMGGVA
jgi:hypothetical protein